MFYSDVGDATSIGYGPGNVKHGSLPGILFEVPLMPVSLGFLLGTGVVVKHFTIVPAYTCLSVSGSPSDRPISSHILAPNQSDTLLVSSEIDALLNASNRATGLITVTRSINERVYFLPYYSNIIYTTKNICEAASSQTRSQQTRHRACKRGAAIRTAYLLISDLCITSTRSKSGWWSYLLWRICASLGL